MQNYALMSDEAKQAAHYLFEVWEQNKIRSTLTLIEVIAGTRVIEIPLAIEGVLERDEFTSPSIHILYELQDFELLRITEIPNRNGRRDWEIHLLPSLKEFVRSQSTDKSKTSASPLFISYSRQDILLRRQIEAELKEKYPDVWSDDQFVGSELWWREILSQISGRNVFIYLISNDSIESLSCRAEFAEAFRLQKGIVPAVIRETKYIPKLILDYHHVKVWDDPDIGVIVGKLSKAIDRASKSATSGELWSHQTPRPKEFFHFTVHADQDPSDKESELNTGIFLIKGDKVELSARGKVTIDKTVGDHADANGTFTNSKGVPYPFPNNDVYPTEGLPSDIKERGLVGSLIGWIGEGTFRDLAFFVGAENEFVVQDGQEGFLYLAVNDVKGAYADNGGAFDVKIRIDRS